MSGESNTTASSAFGLSGSTGWLVGGALGGAIGAIAFGIVLLVIDPEVVSTAIPALYGLGSGPVGWAINIAHGIVLGIVFGLLVTRDPILGVLLTDVETDALSQTGILVRMIGAGFVFGLAVWTILPLLVLPVWIDTVGGSGAELFSAAATGTLVGHSLYGIVLGAVFAAIVDLRGRTADRPLEE